ncbi:MAG: hypothetical protein RIT81_02200 [Deltaproteobacteria bacterium]
MRRVSPLAALVIAACSTGTSDLDSRDAGVIERDAGPRDAGFRDGGTLDSGIPDAGFRDAGERDAGSRDAGSRDGGTCAPGSPRFEMDPASVLIFHDVTTDLDALITNDGDGELHLISARIEPGPDTPAGEFSIPGCNGNPCPLEVALCAGDTLTLPVNFTNTDGTETDFAVLHLETNLPGDPVRTLDLQALRANCAPPPTPIFEVSTLTATVGATVVLDGSMSLPGGPPGTQVVRWDWSWIFTPQPTPTIAGQGNVRASFVPQASGTYFIQLQVQNACNAYSLSPSNAAVNVSP